MKQILILMLAVLFITSSCSKEEDSAPAPTSVEIEGTNYPVVKIGTQLWTAVNFNGAGGINYDNGTNDIVQGKLYSYTEAKAITGLPKGWRIPTQADVNKLMKEISFGTETDVDGIVYTGTLSAKVMSTSGWSFTGTNELGLNIRPTGFYSSIGTTSSFKEKGTSGSFWTTSKSGENVLFYEIAIDTWDNRGNTPRGYILGTTLDGAVAHPTFAEKRPIRFVKDN